MKNLKSSPTQYFYGPSGTIISVCAASHAVHFDHLHLFVRFPPLRPHNKSFHRWAACKLHFLAGFHVMLSPIDFWNMCHTLGIWNVCVCVWAWAGIDSIPFSATKLCKRYARGAFPLTEMHPNTANITWMNVYSPGRMCPCRISRWQTIFLILITCNQKQLLFGSQRNLWRGLSINNRISRSDSLLFGSQRNVYYIRNMVTAFVARKWTCNAV